jgi:hypothetical protein
LRVNKNLGKQGKFFCREESRLEMNEEKLPMRDQTVSGIQRRLRSRWLAIEASLFGASKT